MTRPTVREIPPDVTGALRAVHRLVVLRRPWTEIAAALDAAASLPDAPADLIALERLQALRHCPSTNDDEAEEVLQETAIARAAMPPEDGAWWLHSVCWNRPALVLRYLVPHLEQLESDGRTEAETLDILREQVAIARGEATSKVEEIDASHRVPEEIAEAMRYGHSLRRMGWPPEAAFEVLDVAETLPAAADWMAALARDRVMVGHLYELPEDEMERLARHAIEVHGDAPAWLLASTIVSAAGRHPTIAAKYLPQIMPQAETDLVRYPNVDAEHSMQHARRVLARALAGDHEPERA